MIPAAVIRARRWRHRSGRFASIYGALPWTGAPGNTKADWQLEECGWSWQCENGTVGLGCPPADTYAEALAVANEIRTRCGRAPLPAEDP